MIVGLAGALDRDAQQRAWIGGKRRREDRVALYNAGIAIGGLLAHAGAIDQRDAHAALDEMQRDRGADNAGAEHNRIGACHGFFSLPLPACGEREQAPIWIATIEGAIKAAAPTPAAGVAPQ